MQQQTVPYHDDRGTSMDGIKKVAVFTAAFIIGWYALPALYQLLLRCYHSVPAARNAGFSFGFVLLAAAALLISCGLTWFLLVRRIRQRRMGTWQSGFLCGLAIPLTMETMKFLCMVVVVVFVVLS